MFRCKNYAQLSVPIERITARKSATKLTPTVTNKLKKTSMRLKGDILEAENRGLKQGFHYIIYIEGNSFEDFIGAMLTTSDINGNIPLEEQHFERIDQNGNDYKIYYKESHIVKVRLIKPEFDWGEYTKVGQLSKNGIEFIDEVLRHAPTMSFGEYYYRIKKNNMEIKKILLLVLFAFYFGSIIAQVEPNSDVEIDREFWKKEKINSNKKLDKEYLNNGNLYLNFQSNFDKDSVTIKQNGNFFGSYKLTTDWSTELAEIIVVPDFSKTDNISLKFKNNDEITFEPNDFNQIIIRNKNKKLLIGFSKHVYYYD